jgi:DNA-directed RNA polymerase subunit RPC12/RpoP
VRTTSVRCPRCAGNVQLRTSDLDQIARCLACGARWRALYATTQTASGRWCGSYTLFALRRPTRPERVRTILGRVIDRLRGGVR